MGGIFMNILREHAQTIIDDTLKQVQPHAAVQRALEGCTFPGKCIVIAIGKAAWTMAKAASDLLGNTIDHGVVLTKYDHSQGEIPGFIIAEGGHPLVDENSIAGTEKILAAVENLTEKDTVVFLISGGGSALFEKPAGSLTLADMQNVTNQLLACGAEITEINTIRKHLSAVKGGRFAKLCAPASIIAIALSDILGDYPDAIASGPATADTSTCADAMAVVEKYHLDFPPAVLKQLQEETPKEITNCEMQITGSVSQLCLFAAKTAEKLGYTPLPLSTMLDCEAREAGRFLGSMAKTLEKGEGPVKGPCAILCGGETVVHLTGKGKGGRNQELALAAVPYLEGMENALVAAVGSDGTDGPTDAAGGMVDGSTMTSLRKAGISVDAVLAENDAYHALKAVDSLIITGTTGTNVNDLYFLLFRP